MIRVLLFGVLATKTGTKEIELDVKTPVSLEALLEELRKRLPSLPEGEFLFAVNEEHASKETTVNDGDTVAIMPPFSGG